MNRTRTLLIAAVVLVSIASGELFATASASAHPATAPLSVEDDVITWAVRPSDGQKADGRTSIAFELDPGATASDFFEVTNLGRVAAEFDLSAADGYYTAAGRFNMLPADRDSIAAGTWIRLDRSATVIEAGESVVVPFTISVPDNATPGDHPAGIAASVTSVARSEAGATMGVESRVGFRVMTRVTGEFAPGLEVSGLHANYLTSWDLFRAGAVEVTYVAENTGNTRLRVERQETTRNWFSSSSAEVLEPVELFPGDRRELTARILQVWPLGFSTVELSLSASALPDGDIVMPVSVKREAVVWTVPWLELLIAVGIGLVVVAIFWGRRRQSARIDRLIADARGEGERAGREMSREHIAP